MIELTPDDKKVLQRAARRHARWKYLRWVNLSIGLFLILFAFIWLIPNQNTVPLWLGQIKLHYLLAALGGSMVGTIWRRDNDTQLLLKLAQTQNKHVI